MCVTAKSKVPTTSRWLRSTCSSRSLGTPRMLLLSKYLVPMLSLSMHVLLIIIAFINIIFKINLTISHILLIFLKIILLSAKASPRALDETVLRPFHPLYFLVAFKPVTLEADQLDHGSRIRIIHLKKPK